MRLFKILNGLKSCHGGNHSWTIGEWFEVAGDLIACENGIHLCREQDLLHWLEKDIYDAEYDGEYMESEDKIVVRKARITKHYDNWNDRTARLFACWCARQVLHLNDDPRLIATIETAEKFADGLATDEQLNSASAAARAAAWDAARAAAWDAAKDAASVAARDAAWAAARGAQTKKLIDILDNGWQD
jgi:hypothetical protein